MGIAKLPLFGLWEITIIHGTPNFCQYKSETDPDAAVLLESGTGITIGVNFALHTPFYPHKRLDAAKPNMQRNMIEEQYLRGFNDSSNVFGEYHIHKYYKEGNRKTKFVHSINPNVYLMLEGSRGVLPLILIWCIVIHITSAQVFLSSLQVKINPVASGLLVEPWFSWTIEPSNYGVAQTSYQILVSRFRPNNMDVWKSGVILSNETQFIGYTGPQLILDTRYTWTVYISTSAGSGVASSEFVTGSSTTGGLIGYGFEAQKRDESQLNDMIQSASWIWADDSGISGTSPGDRAFRYILNGYPGNTIKSASVLLCVDSGFTLYVNGYLIGMNENQSSWQQARWYHITFAPDTTQVVFAIKGTNGGSLFDPLNTPGVLTSIQITFENGAFTFLSSDENWRSNLAVPDGFESPGFDDALWRPAKVLAKYGGGIWGNRVIFPPGSPVATTLPVLITAQSSPSQSVTLTSESPIHTSLSTVASPSTITSPIAKTATLLSIIGSTPTSLAANGTFLDDKTTSSSATASTTVPLVGPNPTSSIPPNLGTTTTKTGRGRNNGAIIGGILGGIVLIFLVLAGYLWWQRKARKRFNDVQLETSHPFNLKYTESVRTVSHNRHSSVPFLRRPLSTTMPLLMSMMSTVAEWNRRIRGGTQRGGNNADLLTGVRLQVMEEQLLALDREINSGDDNPELGRVRTNSAVLEAYDDTATLIGG